MQVSAPLLVPHLTQDVSSYFVLAPANSLPHTHDCPTKKVLTCFCFSPGNVAEILFQHSSQFLYSLDNLLKHLKTMFSLFFPYVQVSVYMCIYICTDFHSIE